ncbi:MAG: SMC-Scp complex subunit ScpB [Candidatus Aenigmatarchaeota archaeon]
MKKKTVEAALFLSSGPVPMEDLMGIADCSSGEIFELMEELRAKYGEESGIKLIEANQSWHFIINPDVVHRVKQLSPYRDLSPGLVKALSIIAFKGPLKQSALVNTMGNRTYEYAHELEKRGLISAKREGRTKLLKVTKLFEDYFGHKPENANLERFMETPLDIDGEDEDEEDGGLPRPKKKKPRLFGFPEEPDDGKLVEEQEYLEDAEDVEGEKEMDFREDEDYIEGDAERSA